MKPERPTWQQTAISMLAGLGYLWALPCTLLGLAIAMVPIMGARRIRWHRGTIVVYGPAIAKLLNMVPIRGGAAALTLGHTILACSERMMLDTLEHERIHVNQYQWWGIFFLPAYGLSSAWQYIAGRDPYHDNAFERQARRWS